MQRHTRLYLLFGSLPNFLGVTLSAENTVTGSLMPVAEALASLPTR